ncbi:MAG: BatD family protein [Omnitrophica bacterium]|nr:BatD family protein [Candidatus Omnitrophota bacterium]
MAPNRKIIFCLIVLLLSNFTVSAFARDIRFEVTVDKNKVSLNSTVSLNLTFYGTQSINRIDLPDIHGFNWRYFGPSLKMSIINGRATRSITHMYVLIPIEAGEFSVPPMSVYYNGRTYESNPIPITVVRGPVSAPAPGTKESYGSTVRDLGDKAFLVLEAGKKKAYVNEVIPVTVKLYVNKLAIKDIYPPMLAHRKFSIDEYEKPRQYKEILNGIPYDVIEFNTNAFGNRPGELTLGPAELKCSLLLRRKTRNRRHSSIFGDDDFFGPGAFDSFFGGGYEKYPLNLKSESVPVTVAELPIEFVPNDFTGALGNYQFYLEASPKEVKVGDPITLKLVIAGEGNFNTVKNPALRADGDFKIYDPDVKQDETGKVFEQVIIPKTVNVKEIPAVTFSFFDTSSGKYKSITRGPMPIKVNPLPKGEELIIFETPEGPAGAARAREIFGKDIIYIKDSPGLLKKRGAFLCRNKLFIALQFIPILCVIFTIVFQRRKERLERDIPYARRLAAPRKAGRNLKRARQFLSAGDSQQFFDAVFKTLQEYLGDKFHLPTAGITSNVVEALRGYNIDSGIIDSLKECFGNCDTARYAQSSITKEDMSRTLTLLEGVIDKLERAKI